ncbi:hypothetical protein [Kribbella sp. CA-293567]|uniref:hypothetical protein n=1 Tax=Kribbella sp. CA-293567 TaxID=3002436 RepID=UPI0022DD097E|nr:hypothetical protein [Kribbella sp. CA-293567]WBQ05831.1 hypothetical protein OX958_03295 [Kribbella sp. CA-293567]
MSDQYGGSGDERPGPYQGVFGSSGQQPPQQPPPQQPPYGGQPGAYGGVYGQNPYSYAPDPAAAPKQVRIAAAISLALGTLCVLLGLFTLTSAGAEIANVLTGDPSAKGLVVGVILVSSLAYLLPAIYLRKRRRWARTMMIIVAALGIAGGITALPASLLGLGLHGALLYLMFQEPTKRWFQGPR